MILVNLFGGPGAGKSTGAAYIFSQLKMAGVNCELVTEFAKDKVWEGNKEVFKNQAYIFGKQYFKISRCADKVDVIITDSPLLLSIVYNDNPVLGDSFNETVKNVFSSFNSMNYILSREKEYNPIGRNQTESEAKEVDVQVRTMLDQEQIPYEIVAGTELGYNYIVDRVLEQL
jgi:hypothetical protein